jgi:hypothetical protein
MMHEARAERHRDRVCSKPFVAGGKLHSSMVAARRPLLENDVG